jgi:hypothetical protein
MRYLSISTPSALPFAGAREVRSDRYHGRGVSASQPKERTPALAMVVSPFAAHDVSACADATRNAVESLVGANRSISWPTRMQRGLIYQPPLAFRTSERTLAVGGASSGGRPDDPEEPASEAPALKQTA